MFDIVVAGPIGPRFGISLLIPSAAIESLVPDILLSPPVLELEDFVGYRTHLENHDNELQGFLALVEELC